MDKVDKDHQKICKVCSDKAMGFNFNAITCESCKAFFRRNAYKSEKLRCPFNGNCNIDVITRRFCQKCRLEKCFRVGMKKEWILSEEQKKMKRAKIEQNKLKRQAALECNGESNNGNSNSGNGFEFSGASNQSGNQRTTSVSSNNSNTSTRISIDSSTSDTPLFDDNVETPERFLDYIDKEIDTYKGNLMSPDSDFRLEDGRPERSRSNANESSYGDNGVTRKQDLWRLRVNRRILETNFTPLYLRNDRTQPSHQLNELESMKLEELMTAFGTIDEPLFTKPYDEDHTDITDLVRLSDLSIRRIIKWCKRIQCFRNLCIEDQIALLKGGCLEMMLMKASISFNLDDECWQDEITKCSLTLNVFRTKGDLYNAHREFIKNFNPRWRQDHYVNLLLVAIVLFTPERANLRHPNTVRLEQYSYIYLLRRYLETRCNSVCEAHADHYQLMMKLEDLRELNENHIRIYLEAGTEAIGPLLIEILDLKH
ncbi:nuclear hormone receptor HR96 [Tetranychus urticae]|uniref:Nuclear receptor domain-containing protein n=1 Tax=Tetranychus urticae TaxID=32264 RepID=T1KQC4_TETUR|nr:nuclear hormone receptor HR96 [Tetranychus urticae]